MTEVVMFILTGLAMGLLSGLLGIGGGIILVPMLVFFFGMQQQMAQGISMLIIIPTSLAGLWVLRKQETIDFNVVKRIAVGAILGSTVSANFVQYIPAAHLQKLFGVFVIFVGLRMIFMKKKKAKN